MGASKCHYDALGSDWATGIDCSFFVDEKKLEAEKLREGLYILTTNHPELSPKEAVSRYKELCRLEEGFRVIKDVIDGRPIYHRKDDRICAHLFVAQLALLLMRCLERKLESSSVALSAPDAIDAMKSIGVARLDLRGQTHVIVSRPKGDARGVLKVLGIKNIQPPASQRKQASSGAKSAK